MRLVGDAIDQSQMVGFPELERLGAIKNSRGNELLLRLPAGGGVMQCMLRFFHQAITADDSSVTGRGVTQTHQPREGVFDRGQTGFALARH
jgi:hypothetical protein